MFILLYQCTKSYYIKTQKFDAKVFQSHDEWKRTEGGGGKSYAFANGSFLEKGGINFSDVSGSNLPPTALSGRPELNGASFRAMGVSIVFILLTLMFRHPRKCKIFSAKTKDGKNIWWFGEGLI